jgi:hypothetical protein
VHHLDAPFRWKNETFISPDDPFTPYHGAMTRETASLGSEDARFTWLGESFFHVNASFMPVEASFIQVNKSFI